MGNDQLHRKNRGKPNDYRKRSPHKTAKTKILIVCEDEKTTPDYLEKLLYDYCKLSTAEVKICGKECKSHPTAVYEYAKDFAENSWKNGEDGFDEIYLVIDKDTHDDFKLIKQKIAKEPKILINEKRIPIYCCYSIPCIEYWFLLHFIDTGSFFANKVAVEKRIKQELQKINIPYSTPHFYEALITRTDKAIAHAKKRQKCAAHNEENPITYIHQLIEKLQKIKTM